MNESYRTARPAATSKAPGRGKTVPAQARAPGAKIDFEAIKASVNFRAIVERELALPNGLGNGRCACPFHEDSANPTSFSVRGQKAHCFSCDWSGDVIDFIAQCRSITKAEAARELDTRALRNGLAPGGRAPGGAEGKPKGKGGGYAYKSYEAALEAVQQHKWDGPERWVEREALGKPVESYPYPAPNGRIGAYVLRFERMKDGKRQKTFRPISLHSEGWRIKDPPGKWWPLDANTIAAADTVPLCEGEKCVRIFQRIGFTATTAAHGAQSPELTDWTPLAGKTVPLFPDVGKAGDDWLGKVIPLLLALDPKPIIKVIRLPGLTEDGDDIEQWEALHDSWDAEQLRAELERLIRAAPEWTPPEKPKPTPADLGVTEAHTIKPTSVTWEWKDRIAKGKFFLLMGEGADGKSQIAIALAAAYSTGGPLPGTKEKAPCCDVIFCQAEDGLSDTVVPRLMAAGADLTRIKFTKPMRLVHPANGNPYFELKSFQDLGYWEELLELYPNAGLLIADPLPAYIGRGVNDHKNAELRQVLDPFFDFLESKGVTSVGITHVGKSNDGRKAIHRGLGSVAYGNRARGAFGTNLDTTDPTGENRLFCHIKPFNAKLQPTLVYKIVPVDIKHDGEVIATSRVEFQEGTDARTAEDVMSYPAKREGGLKKREDLADWLRKELADGPVESEEIKRRAKAAGFGRNMLWEVKDKVCGKPIKDGMTGGWLWTLPIQTDRYASNASKEKDYNF